MRGLEDELGAVLDRVGDEVELRSGTSRASSGVISEANDSSVRIAKNALSSESRQRKEFTKKASPSR